MCQSITEKRRREERRRLALEREPRHIPEGARTEPFDPGDIFVDAEPSLDGIGLEMQMVHDSEIRELFRRTEALGDRLAKLAVNQAHIRTHMPEPKLGLILRLKMKLGRPIFD